MFKFTIITLGKFKEEAFRDLEREYLKRLRPFAKVCIIEIPEIPYGKNNEAEAVKKLEAEKIIKQIPKGSVVILLEEKGQLRSSKDFSNFIERLGGIGKELTFIIGSGVGLHDSLHQHSNYSISLSPLTFTHNFARVLLEEQLYRAITILNGKEYHK
jgi:23S rRNA (pseudouridine1915-N3)-methyltransferase